MSVPDKNVYQYVFDLHKKIHNSCELVQKMAGDNKDRYKQFADKSRLRNRSAGDKIPILDKLKPVWKSPFLP